MKEFDRNIAVVVGINQYRNGIKSLQNAVNDAQAIAELLKTKHQYKVRSFLDQEASLENLRDLIETTLPKHVTANDRLLFYFAGHGKATSSDDVPAGFLIPCDADPINQGSWLPMTDLQIALEKLPCRHFLGILDCCYSGAVRWGSSRRDLLAGPEVIYQEHYNRFIQGQAWQFLTSSAADQTASDGWSRSDDRGQGKHSPFATALIEGFEGAADVPSKKQGRKKTGDGIITATELCLYLGDRVDALIGADRDRQTPQLWPMKRHGNGEFIFFADGKQPKLESVGTLDESRNPYRGLESFEEEHQGLFFGRDAIVAELQTFVQKHQLTVVLGASGSGKSSLVKAGLIPKLQAERKTKLQTFVIRPGKSPLAMLSYALNSASNPQTPYATVIFNWRQQNPGVKLLLVIDQCEELITLSQNKQESNRFLSELRTAIASHTDILRVVLTLRSDFEPQLQDLALKDVWRNARFPVRPMSRLELLEAIEKPAEALAIYFESDELVEQLIDDVAASMPGSLPLLSFALSLLYLKSLKRRQEASYQGKPLDRLITKVDYEGIGGVTRSLTEWADQEYEALVKADPAYHQIIRHVMLRMVALGGGEVARRQVPLSELEYPPERNSLAKEVVERFTKARLLVTDPDGNRYVEPAHDALVRGWQKLLNWVREEKNLKLQRRLTPAALEWKSQQQSRFLWSADPYLDVLQQVLDSQDNNWLNQLETEFVQQSVRQKRRETRSRRSIKLTVYLVSTTLIFSAATFVGTIWFNLTHKQNVVLFASPGQKISGITDYRYLYTSDTARAYKGVYNQIIMGFSKNQGNKTISEGVPACIEVGQLGEKGERNEDRNSFQLAVPQEPGVYYVKFRSALEYSCNDNSISNSAIRKWESGEYTVPEQSDIGIVVVGNVFNFAIYPEILAAYSKNIPNSVVVTGDENPNSGVYVSLRNFWLEKK